MPSFVQSREVPLAAQSLHESLGDVLESIATRSQADAIVLSALVGKGTGRVSVPVELSVTKRSAKDSSIAVTIKARSAKAFFPRFKGAFYALPMAPARTNLRLKGTYTVPLGPLGSTINAAGMHKMAEDSLRDLFERVADETIAAIRKESDRRYRQARTSS
ncbi:MAG TPA: hypothetical protein VN905_01300 [Candidatus Binatia bacterium]|nr:hypothetical protein [Candidatus Binatia bacterium]